MKTFRSLVLCGCLLPLPLLAQTPGAAPKLAARDGKPPHVLSRRLERRASVDRFFRLHQEQLQRRGKATAAISGADSLHTGWTRLFASAASAADDGAADVAVDDSGNAYVTGGSSQLPFGQDYLTIKYSPSGSVLWLARFDGGTNGEDAATAIAVDRSHNVYVTGSSALNAGESDYATVKYNAAGIEQWVARYSGPVRLFNEPTRIIVDTAGNVYITGWSRVIYDASHYVTIKYDSLGHELWVAHYAGLQSGYDDASGIGVDRAGNVYVTGTSSVMNVGSVAATVKYNANGTEQWVRRYAGPGGSSAGASALALDDSGNILITGGSYGLGTSDDFTTIKYDSSGSQLWIARYDGGMSNDDQATALATDAQGNVYVCGASIGGPPISYDIATVKYDANGVQQWAERYAGPGQYYDWPHRLAVDRWHNVIVSGTSTGASYDYVTIKYDSAGAQLWVMRYDGTGNCSDEAYAVALNDSGDVYVTGGTCSTGINYDYATVKYSSAGIQQWVERYDGPGKSYETAQEMTVDSGGNVYVTGGSSGSQNGYDFLTLKYDTDGDLLWAVRFDNRRHTDDFPDAVAVDRNGNVYVTGESFDPVTHNDIATVKYNSSGIQQWVTTYEGGSTRNEEGVALAIDRLGNVYVAGSDYGSAYITIKYDSAGTEQWVERYTGAGTWGSSPSAIAVDDSGNAYVTGESQGQGTNEDIATVKYSPAGTQLWAGRYNGPGNQQDYGQFLKLDSHGNVYVGGTSATSDTQMDYVTIKYTSGGVQQWATRYNAPGTSADWEADLAVSDSGNVYVAGSSGTSTGSDYVTVKYNPQGQLQWVQRYAGPDNSYDDAAGLALDRRENVYVTGSSDDVITTVQYDASGIQLGVAHHAAPSGGVNSPIGIAADAPGNIYVAGTSACYDYSWRIYTAIKYSQVTVPVSEVPPLRPFGFHLGQNYPNPFNPTTEVRFEIADVGFVSLKVYDVLGREVATLVNEEKKQGEYQVTWDSRRVASGVYFYQLKAGRFLATRRMVIIK